VKVGAGADPLLRRPISVCDVRGSRTRIVFRVVGRGTELLSRVGRGDELDVLGPLGKPAPMPGRGDVLLVGGGIGVAPLLLLARRWGRQRRVSVLLGAKTKALLILRREFRELGVPVTFATDDGSAGRRGLVTELAVEAPQHLERPTVYACGPHVMLRDLVQRLDPIPVLGFIEERMGCGTGICYCCALPRRGGGYVRFCQEGPVVLLNEAVL
jgi:dihydroorotate dehydrogenase electron transfer subunit